MQITEQQQIAFNNLFDEIDNLFYWVDLSRGFHGGEFISNELLVFDRDGEQQTIEFSVKQYTSDRTDYFGTFVDAWEIVVRIRDRRFINNVLDYETDVKYRVGEDYACAEYAKDFCSYIFYSIKRYGNISRLPFSQFCDDND